MAFQLKLNESVGEGIQRVVKREIAKALEHLRAHGKDDDAVREVRKGLKKVRAALRLVRDELGETAYHRENFEFRDAARPLTEIRDAKMFVETLDKLVKDSAGEIEGHAFDKVREALLQHQQVVTKRVLTEDGALAKVAEAVERALARVPDLTINQDGWRALEPGLKRVYRAGHRALAAAAAESTTENLHEWRKQTKYLWHQLQLVEPAWVASEKELGNHAHELARLLGDDHDLGILRQLVTADPLIYGGHRVLKGLVTLIDRRRRVLQEKAFVLGRQIYRDTPKLFTSRIEGSWTAWSSHVDGAKPVVRSRRAPDRPEAPLSTSAIPANPKPRAPRASRRGVDP